MAEDLKRFIFEERENYRRYKSNIDLIIRKYDRHFADDAEVDLTTLTSYSIRDEKQVKRLKPRPFGHTKLLSTRKKELSDSVVNGSCISRDESLFSDGNSSVQDTTLHGSPPNMFSSECHKTFVKNDISSLDETEYITEEDPEFLALKTSYFEIMSEKNEEPSDAETLSSYSSDDTDSLLEDDDSEDGDDEDSQADDKIPALTAVYDDHDSVSLSSTEDNMKELTEIDKTLVPHRRENLKESKRVFDFPQQLKSLQMELENVKKGSVQVKDWLNIGGQDEIDGDISLKYTDKSGYCQRDKLTDHYSSDRYNSQKMAAVNSTGPLYDKNYNNHQRAKPSRIFRNMLERTDEASHMKSNRPVEILKETVSENYQQNKRIEKWVENINLETGVNQHLYDNYIVECCGGQIADQTYVVQDKSKMNDNVQADVSHVYEKRFGLQANETKYYRPSIHQEKYSEFKNISRNSPRRIVPTMLKSLEMAEEKNVYMIQHEHNMNRTSYPKTTEQILRQDQLQCRNVIGKFASPDRLLKKMKENKVGVAAMMFNTESKNRNTPNNLMDHKEYLTPIEKKMCFFEKATNSECKKQVNGSPLKESNLKENIDFFITEDEFDNESNYIKHPTCPVDKTESSRKVARSVPALKLVNTKFSNEAKINNNINTELIFSRDLESNTHRNRLTVENSNEFGTGFVSNFNVPVETRTGSNEINSGKEYGQIPVVSDQQKDNSELGFSVKKFKKPDKKRKFVIPENTANLIELMLNSDKEIATIYSPKSFHRKFDQVNLELKPAEETLTCLTSNVKTYKVDSFTQKADGNIQVETVHSKHGHFSNLSSVGTRQQECTQSSGQVDSKMLKLFQSNEINERYNVVDKQQNVSPYRSAKDLSNIELFVNSSLYSPDLQKNRQLLTPCHEVSKSVPAKMKCDYSNTPTNNDQKDIFVTPSKTFCRTKLKAKRSLKLIGNDYLPGNSESVDTQLDQGQQFSRDFHTPIKGDNYRYSLNEESPSTTFSRLLLSTPSPSNQKHSEKFSRFKYQLEKLTCPKEDTIRYSEILTGLTEDTIHTIDQSASFKKPVSYGQNELLYPSRRTNLVTRYTSSTVSHPSTAAAVRHPHTAAATSSTQDVKPMAFLSSIQNRGQTSWDQNRPVGVTAEQSDQQTQSENAGSRRKALFQSTPMKPNIRFQLDNTVSTIFDLMSDEEDCEVMTISDSP